MDPDAPDAVIDVHLYVGGPAGSGAPGFPVHAGLHRDDLCVAIGSCNHGYSLATPPMFFDGADHTVFAYGIDTMGGDNPLLGTATFRCAAPVATPDASAPDVVSVPDVASVPDGVSAPDVGSAPDVARVPDVASEEDAGISVDGEVVLYEPLQGTCSCRVQPTRGGASALLALLGSCALRRRRRRALTR